MKGIIGITLIVLFGLVLVMGSIDPVGALVLVVGGLFAAMSFAPLAIQLGNELESQSLHESYHPLPVASPAGCD